jgi:polyisoprenoid-binding protein YceI
MQRLSTASPVAASRGGVLRLLLAITALASAAPASAVEPWPGPAPQGVYVLEPRRSQFVASVRVLGLSRYPVGFSGMAGRFDASPQVAGGPRVTIRVDPRSISNPRSVVARAMLTQLEPERFPQIEFASRALGETKGQMWLLGDLTLHGVTRPVRLTLAVQQVAPGPDGPARFAVSGRGRIRRSDFGLPAMHSLVGDQVELTFQAQFVQTPPDCGARQARRGAPPAQAQQAQAQQADGQQAEGSDDLE